MPPSEEKTKERNFVNTHTSKLPAAIRAAIGKRGRCQARDVVEEVSTLISDEHARHYFSKWRKYHPLLGVKKKVECVEAEQLARGRLLLVLACIENMRQRGMLLRVARGVYSLPDYKEETVLQAVVRVVSNSPTEMNVNQVLDEVGSIISAALAIRTVRRKQQYERERRGGSSVNLPLEAAVIQGKKLILFEALDHAFHSGKIRRLRRGIYGPLPESTKQGTETNGTAPTD